MKIRSLIVVLSLSAAFTLQADEQIREAQQFLKDQGFYYGQVDGEGGTETAAAIRRFQIRNGLEVNGQLNSETLAAMKNGSAETTTDAAPPAETAPAPPEPRAPKTRKDIAENDREFLDKQSPRTPAPVPPPSTSPGVSFSSMFRKTPYENAPIQVQETTLRRAQSRLAREGFYNGAIDGVPGPSTVRALLRYQADADLRETGRLDLDTLADMGLLPNSIRNRFFPRIEPPPSRSVYRGIWIR